jgi:hypothetical protein
MENDIKQILSNIEKDLSIESNRALPLPNNINSPHIREEIISSWNTAEINSIDFNNSLYDSNRTTLHPNTLAIAAMYIKKFFLENKITLNILELGCGNCKASSIIKKILGDIKWQATDIIDYKACNINEISNFDKVNTIDAVKKYGKDSNVLLLISPQPGDSYSDYYACYDFIDQVQKGEDKYIVIIGELGGGDGSKGMYKYMMENPNLVCVLKETINNNTLLIKYDINTVPDYDSDLININGKDYYYNINMKNGLYQVPRHIFREVLIFKIKSGSDTVQTKNLKENVWRAKYLKYKNKYLELKNY